VEISSTKLNNTFMATPSVSTMSARREPQVSQQGTSHGSPKKPTDEQLRALREALDSIKIQTLILHRNINDIHTAKFKRVLGQAQSLSGKLGRLQAAAGLAFHGFQNLPEKLRRRIWTYAALAPNIIAVDHVDYHDSTPRNSTPMAIVPNSRHASLLHVNKESRSVAKQVLQPYHVHPRGVLLVFTNLSNDIIWLINRGDPEDWDYYGDNTKGRFLDGLKCLSKPQQSHPHTRSLRRLAFSLKVFMKGARKDASSKNFVELIEKVNEAGVNEVYVVVKGDEAAKEPDIVFEQPKRKAT
jgi:2EXR family